MLALIDLDGVVADSSVRFAQAHEASTNSQPNWNVAFDPKLVETDTVIPGALETINALIEQGYWVEYVTSRPHYMGGATSDWLRRHGFRSTFEPEYLLLKTKRYDTDERWQKTPAWKAGIVAEWAEDEATKSTCDLIFVDDETANRAAVAALSIPFVRTFASLSDIGL